MASYGEGTLDANTTGTRTLATWAGSAAAALGYMADLRVSRGAASLGGKTLRDTTAPAAAGASAVIGDKVQMAATVSGVGVVATYWGGATVRSGLASSSAANDATPTFSAFVGSAASFSTDAFEAAARCVMPSCSTAASLSGLWIRVALVL
jgi:hypothetical protein